VAIEGLIQINGDFQAEPVLATAWERSEDGKTYTFELRKGVTWHDGRMFTADDVVYSLTTIPPLHARAASIFKNVKSVAAPDPHRVVVELKSAFGPFLTFLTSDNVPILPAHVFDGRDPATNPASLAPIGTGPFKFESWHQGQSIRFNRYEDHWDTGKPYLDSLIFSIIPDANSRLSALEAGNIDLIVNYDMRITDVEFLRSLPNVTLIERPGIPRALLLSFNTKAEPLDRAEVRRALFRGIDREMILQSGFGGQGILGISSISPKTAWAYNPDIDYMKMYPYDPEGANTALDDAGLARSAGGKRFDLRMAYTPAQGGFDETAEILRANWAALGVGLNLEPRERNAWVDQVYVRRDFDVSLNFYLAGADPAFGVDRAYLCSEIRPASSTNASQYCNEALDTMFMEAKATAELEKRVQSYHDAQALIAREVPSVVLVESPHLQAVSSDFGNVDLLFKVSSEANMRFSEVFRR
jgi:peptide/nickel transport system substrate-binding protein